MSKKNIRSTEDTFWDKLLLSIWPYFIVGVAFIAFWGYVFKWGRILSWRDLNYVVDNELLGTFGDFIGGVLGTIFTIISTLLVVRTFRHQRKVTTDNENEVHVQRFNDLFFELLRIYQNEVNELCGQADKILKIDAENNRIKKATVKYNNKDYFDEEKYIIQRRYRNQKSYEKNQDRSITYYMLFYTDNRSKIAAYYRTLYRIFELIDESDLINDEQKKEYAKIIRAQLTESELFFLRYNAMTIYGNPFIKYINKYHILKHLPAFELLEFKDWWVDMNNFDRESVNILYFIINNALKDVFNNAEKRTSYSIEIMPDKKAKYQISLSLKEYRDFAINLVINNDSSFYTNEYRGLNKLEPIRIQQLFDCFIKELFIYSNFGQYNRAEDIEVYSRPIISEGNIVRIHSAIKNNKGDHLIFSYKGLT